MPDKVCDLIIVGSGPSAMSAAIYTSRENIGTTIYEKSVVGGVVASIDQIDNYPGYSDGVTGVEFSEQLEKQVKRFGGKFEYGNVESISLSGKYKDVIVDGKTIKAKSVLIATGRRYGKLNVANEDEYIGRGVHYCATCDGFFYRGKKVVVVGGGNSAVQESIYLLKFVDHIDLLVRSTLKCSEILKEELSPLIKSGKISLYLGSTIKELIPIEGHIGKVVIDEKDDSFELDTDGVFIFTGMKPNSDFVKNTEIEISEEGYIKTDDNMETSMPGVFASGDVRYRSVKQISTAIGEGAKAAISIRDYLKKF